MINVLIKNKISLFFLITLISISSCQLQINDKKDDENMVGNNIIDISFDNESIIYKKLNSEELYSYFIIQLNNSNIKFKENYIFLINNYSNKNNLKFILTKINNKKYTLEIIQETKHLTIDKFIFRENEDNMLELTYMEQVQPGNITQICQYNMSRKDGNKINLISDSIIDPKCYSIKEDSIE